jgi:4'-phosphopantetheinyl transferase
MAAQHLADRVSSNDDLAASPLPPAGPGVALWLVDLDRAADTGALSADEQARAARFVFERDARRFRHARAALRRLLARSTGTPAADLVFDAGAHGKPALRGIDLPFNLSHAGPLGLIGIGSAHAIGVDIELLHRIDQADALAQRLYTPGERALLAALDGSAYELAFLRCWTRKEACLKAVGCGLAVEPASFEAATSAEPGVAQIASEGRVHRVCVHSLPLAGRTAVAALAWVDGAEAAPRRTA